MSVTLRCWCGNSNLELFAPGFLRCTACHTLIRATEHGADITKVTGDDQGFYGREYWFSYQEQNLDLPNIVARSRTDLPNRCLHWLRVVLKYKLPPADALELGSAHGGFVALMRWAGFTATGLELSPSIVEFAHRTFGVPVLLGPVEDQQIEPESLDLIVLMDVLEHLPDPVRTMQRCLDLLKPDGILVIQTPRYREGTSHDEMAAREDPFLSLLKEDGHLFMFSQNSIRELFFRLGANYLEFEPPVFAHYDMFCVVSHIPLTANAPAEIEASLARSPTGHAVQAMLDLDEAIRDLRNRHAASEADRLARLKAIDDIGQQLAESEADRANRLKVIEEQGARLIELDARLAETHSNVVQLSVLRHELEQDRLEQARRLEALQSERDSLENEVTALRNRLETLSALPVIRLLRRLHLLERVG